MLLLASRHLATSPGLAISHNKNLPRLLPFLLLLLLTPLAHALDWRDSPQLSRLFAEAGIRGTFVLYDVDAQRLVGHDRARAETRYSPGSTFKIANALIGLASGAVSGVDEVLPHGGGRLALAAWERDMSLREAMALSNLAIFQGMARRVGLPRMQAELARLGYGNGETGATVDRFWLDGSLAISAVEQARFVADLARGALPYPAEAQAAVTDIVKLEANANRTLYGKTGWPGYPEPGIGWWVGWVRKGERVYAFALNLDMREAADAGKRVALGRACLAALGVL